MDKRPDLTRNLSSTAFKSYYYLKQELVDFCKEIGLQATGSKLELVDRITHFLDTGEKVITLKKKVKPTNIGAITEDSVIEANFVCSEKHRIFFKSKIGSSFSFNVPFQKWLKSNTGKSYKEAIEAYYLILEEKKNGKRSIDKQFEYNTYIRDFFNDNDNKALDDAIKCWKYKKGLKGHNRYEKSDLIALN